MKHTRDILLRSNRPMTASREVSLKIYDGRIELLLTVPAKFGGVEEVVDKMNEWVQHAYDMGRRHQVEIEVSLLNKQMDDIKARRDFKETPTITKLPLA